MNEQAKQAGGATMRDAERNSSNHTVDNRTTVAIAAGILMLVGSALQWVELLFTRFVSDNSWLFATLFGQAWNMINVWLSAAQWHQDLQYWPLLLVITGGVILFSRGPKPAVAVSESRMGARRDA
jgi:uncharacterized membrane protein YeiB